FSRFKENCEIAKHAIEALGAALAGSDRPLIVTSGTGLLTPGRLVTEETEPPAGGAAIPRVSEQTALWSARTLRRQPSTLAGSRTSQRLTTALQVSALGSGWSGSRSSRG